VTPYGTVLDEWNIPEMWQQISKTSDFNLRFAKVQEYNAQNMWTKKAITLTPIKFGIGMQGDLVCSHSRGKANILTHL
jgi:xanthine dehydrogenase/oxidase